MILLTVRLFTIGFPIRRAAQQVQSGPQQVVPCGGVVAA